MRTGVACGFSLVEVLVATLVLALGLIGAAAMQLTALRTRHHSMLLSKAVHLASGMADQMRANAGQMRRDDRDNAYLQVDYDAASDAAADGPAPDCFSAACDDAELAHFDLDELKRQLRRELPGARLVICRDGGAGDDAPRAPGWACSGAAGAPVLIKLGWTERQA
ncbi:MAG: type IV pilus modification protein PilV, partial [Burkholderiaceae bacterium]|nr:type IV pilus modification protein PilV [Burkholderiaceae bacterium]